MVKKYLGLFILLFVQTISAQRVSGTYSEAIEFFNKKEYARAVQLFDAFFEEYKIKDEIFASAKFYSSEALLNLGQYNGAAEGFEYLVNKFEFTNYRDKSLYKLGLVYYQMNEYERARSRFQQLISQHPETEYFGSSLYWIGESFSVENKLEEAIQFFQEAISNRANNTFIDYTIYSLANTYEKIGDYVSAVTYYDELLSFYRESELVPSAQIRIGVCYFKLKEYDSSILELNNPIIRDLPVDKQIEALYLLANSYYRIAEYDNAAKTYLEIISKYPKNELIREVQYSLGWSYFQQKKYNDSYKMFNHLSEGTDTIGEKSFYWKAESRRYAGYDEDALKLYNDFLKRFPQSELAAQVQFQIGLIYFNADKTETASNYLKQAAGAIDEITRAKALTMIGEIELNRKNYAGAMQNFSAVADIYSKEDDIEYRSLLGLAISNFYLNKVDDALNLFIDLEVRAPLFEQAKVSFYIAECYFAKSNYSEALKYYNRVSTDDPQIGNLTLYGKAYSYFNLKDYKNASYQFSDFNRKYSFDSKIQDVKLRLADSYFADKNFDSAIRIYEEILASRDRVQNRDHIIYQYALALYRANRVNKALTELNRIKDGFSKSAYYENALYLIGWISFQQNNFYDAILNYKNFLSLSPRSRLTPVIYYSLGDAYFNLGSYDSAIVYYEKILSDHANTSYVFDAVNGIQYCYIARGESDKAVRMIDNFVLRNPNSEFADRLFLKKGEIFYSLRNYEQAKNGYKEFIAYFAKSKYVADAYYWVGKSAQNLNQFEEAILNYNIVINNYSSSEIATSAVIEAGSIYNQQKRYNEAINVYDKGITKFKDSPRLPEIMFAKGEAYLKKGDVAAAYDLFDEIAMYYSQSIFGDKSRMEVGIIELNSKRFDNALKHFNTIIQKRTDDLGAKAQYYVASVYYEQNRINDAITALVRVINVYPAYEEWNAKSYLKLADCYIKNKNSNKAKEMYRTVISKYRGTDYANEAQNKLRRVK